MQFIRLHMKSVIIWKETYYYYWGVSQMEPYSLCITYGAWSNVVDYIGIRMPFGMQCRKITFTLATGGFHPIGDRFSCEYKTICGVLMLFLLNFNEIDVDLTSVPSG